MSTQYALNTLAKLVVESKFSPPTRLARWKIDRRWSRCYSNGFKEVLEIRCHPPDLWWSGGSTTRRIVWRVAPHENKTKPQSKSKTMSWVGEAVDKVSPKNWLLRRSLSGGAVETHQHIAGRNSSTWQSSLGLCPVLLFRVMTRWTRVAEAVGGWEHWK